MLKHTLFRKFVAGILPLLYLLIAPAPAFARTPLAPHDSVITNCANDSQLRAAVSSGGVITFNCGTATIPINSFIEVPGDVTIDGADTITLNGRGTSAFFQVFVNGKLTLRNLSLRNGTLFGAHPIEIFGEATLDHVTLTASETDNSGGAVMVYGNAKLTVRDSTFTSNAATNPTLAAAGAAIKIEGGAATVANSTFSENRISGNLGGGGAIGLDGGSLVISQSTFISNSAQLGGAIYVKAGSLAIDSGDFRRNAGFDGGALFVGSGTQVTVTQSTFISNTAGYGGAIESNGELQVDFSSFRQNRATTGDGGALWILNSDGDITYSTFSDNQATTTGGAISCYANTLSIIHSTLNGNQSGGHGGAIYSTCNLNFTNNTVSGNRAPGKGGGGIYQATSGFATVAASTIFSNTAAFGAGVYNDGSGTSTLTLQATILADNATGNCDGVVASNGYNLSTDTNCGNLTQTGDQQKVALPLGPLADNGGPTFTHMLLPGNPAIDAIPTPCNFAVDQRDVTRPQGGKCDIGAVEAPVVSEFPRKVYLPVIRA